jgi:hypothetical protein
MSIDPMVSQTVQPYVFTDDNPLNSTDALGNVEVALDGGGIPTAQEQQSVTIAMENNALKKLGVAANVVQLIDNVLKQQINEMTEPYLSEEMDSILSQIETLKYLNGIMLGIQIAGIGIEDIQEHDGVGYAFGDAVFSGSGLTTGTSIAVGTCDLMSVEDPFLLLGCGIIGGWIGVHAGHTLWTIFSKALHLK